MSALAQQRRHLGLRQAAVKADPVLPGGRDDARVPPLLGVGAAHVDHDAGVLLAQVAQRAEQDAEPLAPLDAPAEDDAERAFGAGGRRVERLEVDARRDHAVGAGERDRGGVAGGDRRGDGRVQRIEEAAELRARRPERPHVLGIGVEGRHQRATGVAERRPAEPRHEGLVEVKDVEVLGAEQDVDVGDEVGRGGDELERAALANGVGRAGEEVARVRLAGQEDRLAFSGEDRLHPAVRLVHREAVGARRDHRDPVPAQREPLGQGAHLVVDRRGGRPEEGREDAELETHAPHATPPSRADTRARRQDGRGRGLTAPAPPARRHSCGALTSPGRRRSRPDPRR